MRFLVTETCGTSSRCEFITPAHIIEAASPEEAKAAICEEKAGYFNLDRITLWKGHRIEMHLIEETQDINFSTFVDKWEEVKLRRLRRLRRRTLCFLRI